MAGDACLFKAGQALGRVSRRDRLPHVAAGQKLVLMFPYQYGVELFYRNRTALIESELSVSYGLLEIIDWQVLTHGKSDDISWEYLYGDLIKD